MGNNHTGNGFDDFLKKEEETESRFKNAGLKTYWEVNQFNQNTKLNTFKVASNKAYEQALLQAVPLIETLQKESSIQKVELEALNNIINTLKSKLSLQDLIIKRCKLSEDESRWNEFLDEIEDAENIKITDIW